MCQEPWNPDGVFFVVFSRHNKCIYIYICDISENYSGHVSNSWAAPFQGDVGVVVTFAHKSVPNLLPDDALNLFTCFGCLPVAKHGRSESDRIGLLEPVT